MPVVEWSGVVECCNDISIMTGWGRLAMAGVVVAGGGDCMPVSVSVSVCGYQWTWRETADTAFW